MYELNNATFALIKSTIMRVLLTSCLFIVILSFMSACGGSGKDSADETGSSPKSMVPDTETYDPKRGVGKFTAENLTLGPIDASMATNGESISQTKCQSCHKLTDEKLVGPGWKGVTSRRTGHWIMNFITNPDPMIDKDPELQAQLELCLVRMPNQNLNEEEARQILEFMRQNDAQ